MLVGTLVYSSQYFLSQKIIHTYKVTYLVFNISNVPLPLCCFLLCNLNRSMRSSNKVIVFMMGMEKRMEPMKEVYFAILCRKLYCLYILRKMEQNACIRSNLISWETELSISFEDKNYMTFRRRFNSFWDQVFDFSHCSIVFNHKCYSFIIINYYCYQHFVFKKNVVYLKEFGSFSKYYINNSAI